MFKKIKRALNFSKFTANEEAAIMIRRFVAGTTKDYEWDEFEVIEEENPDVNLAIHICWYFAKIYPSQKEHEYCDSFADKYFLAVADSLEKGCFSGMNHSKLIDQIKNMNMPNLITEVLESQAHSEEVQR